MWVYEKKLQYPVRVSKCNPRLAKYLIEQYGGADGELAAALRYLNQRYTLPDKVKGLLTDIGTEEFAHLEMIATMVYKLTMLLYLSLKRWDHDWKKQISPSVNWWANLME
ncbi:manganese containing catalase [Hazenella coriacea]|uniref:Manganese containing catalase n=1 Tax=Hazenella coriacea TaxID=1179467 RepID=A0A4V2UV96_9BACL|nr:manganese containing catalase [Hazenella coriacea]